jgi:hypothetical protein
MGVFTEQCVDHYKLSHQTSDAFAIASATRSKLANDDGSCDWTMAPVTLPGKAGDTLVKCGLKRDRAGRRRGDGGRPSKCCERDAAGRSRGNGVRRRDLRAQCVAARRLLAHRHAHLQGGALAGVAAALGINVGCVVHELAAALGLAAMPALHPQAFLLI